jgi:hypothetical protein
VIGCPFISPPGDFGHRSKKTASAYRRLDLGKSLGDLAEDGLFLEYREGKVAKSMMPAH